MTRAWARLDLLSYWWLGLVALACVIDGVVAGLNPTYGVVVGGGLMYAIAVLMDPILGLVLFTAFSFLDFLSGSGSFSGTKVLGVILFASWLARVTAGRRKDARSFAVENPWLAVALVSMLGWCALSYTWAQSRGAVVLGTETFALDMMLLPITFFAVREPKHVLWVLAAFVAGALFSALYGFLNPASLDEGRAAGAVGDPNAEGVVLAASIPLLISMAGIIRRSARMKVVALVGVIIMFLGLVSTVSREALLSLAAVMICACLFGGRWRKRATILLIVGAAVTVGYFVVLAPLAARQRVTMADTSGRSTVWPIALRVIAAHPLLGVGTNNFIVVEGRYINRPGLIDADVVIDHPLVTHDAFLESAADLGIPGLVTFVWVLVLCLRTGVQATRKFERLGDVPMEMTSRAVLLALVATLTSDFFVAGEFQKFLWLLLALCPALLAMARRREQEALLLDGSAVAVGQP